MWLTVVSMAQVGISIAQFLICLGDKIEDITPIVQVIIQPMIFTSGTYANLETLWFLFK
jgi:ABC-type polysaccharide/polyol phosphate export permease